MIPSPSPHRRVRAVARGRVQGIGFRWFVRETAERLGVSGWVRNLADGGVELEAQADAAALAELMKAVRGGPPYARVDSVEEREIAPVREEGFGIR